MRMRVRRLSAISVSQLDEKFSRNVPWIEFPGRRLGSDPATTSTERRVSALCLSLFLSLLVMRALLPIPSWAQVAGSSITFVRGQLRFLPNPPVLQGIPITLEDERGGTVGRTQTDSQGRFVFTVNAHAIYIIRVRVEGYREVAQRVDLVGGFVSDVLIVLKSLSASAIPDTAQKEFDKGNSLLLESKDPTASISHFQKAIEVHPSFAEAHLLLGMAYMDLGKWKQAQSALENAIKMNDKLAGAHLALGACYNQQKDFAAAEKALLRGLELNEESAEGQYELARTYWALGRWQEAEPHARKAIQLQPGFAAVHVLMGNILLRKRDARGALQEFKEYLRLDPQGPFASATREMVAKIEKALASP